MIRCKNFTPIAIKYCSILHLIRTHERSIDRTNILVRIQFMSNTKPWYWPGYWWTHSKPTICSIILFECSDHFGSNIKSSLRHHWRQKKRKIYSKILIIYFNHSKKKVQNASMIIKWIIKKQSAAIFNSDMVFLCRHTFRIHSIIKEHLIKDLFQQNFYSNILSCVKEWI